MEKNYQKIQEKYFKSNASTCDADPTVYANLIWTGVSVSQVDLDDKWLDYLKFERCNEIDAKSGDLIVNNGHAYNAKTFSLKQTAQINILGIDSRKDMVGLLPLTMNTMDNTDTEVLSTVSDVDDFFLSALVAKKGILDSGTALKDQIRAAITEAEVDLVVDNR